MYLSLYCKGSKRLFKVCVWEGAGDQTETAIFWPPLLWPSTLCLSRSPDAQLEAQRPTLLGDGFLYYILSATSLVPNSSGPQGPFGLMWLSLPHLVYNSFSNCNCNCLTSVLTELYNSSTPTQSPTRFLESHVRSSSRGNNCHAVHRSLSSGASVYECTMGIFFTSSHFISQFLPTRFPLITAIRMCHLLPVHHLGMAFLAGSKVKIQHKIRLCKWACCLEWWKLGKSVSDESYFDLVDSKGKQEVQWRYVQGLLLRCLRNPLYSEIVGCWYGGYLLVLMLINSFSYIAK